MNWLEFFGYINWGLVLWFCISMSIGIYTRKMGNEIKDALNDLKQERKPKEMIHAFRTKWTLIVNGIDDNIVFRDEIILADENYTLETHTYVTDATFDDLWRKDIPCTRKEDRESESRSIIFGTYGNQGEAPTTLRIVPNTNLKYSIRVTNTKVNLTFKELLDLPADDVVEYLKDRGL